MWSMGKSMTIINRLVAKGGSGGASTSPSLSGYVEIKDESGTIRKVGVIS